MLTTNDARGQEREACARQLEEMADRRVKDARDPNHPHFTIMRVLLPTIEGDAALLREAAAALRRGF